MAITQSTAAQQRKLNNENTALHDAKLGDALAALQAAHLTDPTYGLWITGALAAADAAAGVFTWQNNLGVDVVVVKAVVRVTTVATGAGTLSVGQATTAVLAANLIDTVDVHTAVGAFDNITDKGTNGKSRQVVKAGEYVTGSKQTGAMAGLVGTYAIQVIAL